MDYDIRPAFSTEIAEVAKLLDDNKLPVTDINDKLIQFFVCVIEKRIIGVVGVEDYAPLVLLRSLAVHNDFKGVGIGLLLLNRFFSFCRSKKIFEIYLLTETAEKYFRMFGFNSVDRKTLPVIIKQTKEFKSICPESAVAMYRKL
jgi:amino-acid N-acetyltransferase